MASGGETGRAAVVALIALLLAGCAAPPSWTADPYDPDGKADGFGERSNDGRVCCALASESPCLAADPVLVESTLTEWVGQLDEIGYENARERRFGVTECRWVHEVQGTLLCGSYELASMNRFLARASMYVEGTFVGHRGEIVATDDPLNDEAARGMAGHDLRSEDLMRFYDAVESACAADLGVCLTDHERAMRDLLTRVARDYGPFVVLTFAVSGTSRPSDVVSHEVLHAQYFMDLAYRAAVDEYWAGLDYDARLPVVEILGRYYDADDELLVRNEFQAYVLQVGADRGLLWVVASEHRGPLAEALRRAGVTPVRVETGD